MIRSISNKFFIIVLFFWLHSPLVFSAPFAYIPNSGDNTVSVIDISTDVVVGVLKVGEAPFNVAVDVTGSRAYVAHRGDKSIFVIDAIANSVVDRFNVDLIFSSIALDPKGRYIYILGRDQKENLILSVRNVVDFKEIKRLQLENLRGVSGIPAVTLDGAKLYVMVGSYGLAVVDTESLIVLEPSINVQVGGHGHIAFSPTRDVAYIAGGNWVTVNLKDNTVANDEKFNQQSRMSIGGCGNATGIAVDKKGNYGYLSVQEGCLFVIDLLDQTVTSRIKVGKFPSGLAISPDGKKVYVVNEYSNSVSVFDLATKSILREIKVGERPVGWGQFIQPYTPSLNSTLLVKNQDFWSWFTKSSLVKIFVIIIFSIFIFSMLRKLRE